MKIKVGCWYLDKNGTISYILKKRQKADGNYNAYPLYECILFHKEEIDCDANKYVAYNWECAKEEDFVSVFNPSAWSKNELWRAQHKHRMRWEKVENEILNKKSTTKDETTKIKEVCCNFCGCPIGEHDSEVCECPSCCFGDCSECDEQC